MYRQVKPIMPRPRSSRYRGQVYSVEPAAAKRPDVSVSFTVMAHPKRHDWAVELSEFIGCGITWDVKNDRHDTGLRAIEAYDSGADYHCVVQDDAIVADDFVESLKEALKYPDEGCPVGLYYGGKGGKISSHTQSINEAVRRDASWLVRKGPIWGPGIVYPVSTIGELGKYFRDSIVENYDRRVMKFYQSVGKNCWYTVPSLVDHRQEDNPSLCGHDRPNRMASFFCGPQSALDVDWSRNVVKAAM